MRSTAALLGAASLLVGGAVAAADVAKSYRLYHKLGNSPALAPRGTVTIATSDADSGLVATFHPEEGGAALDTAAFDGMVEDGALYTLVVTEGDAAPPSSYPPPRGQYASASVPGCSLRRSNLREQIGLSVGPTGKLLGVSYRPLISPLAPKTCDRLKPLSDKPEAIFGRNEGEGDGGSHNAMPFKTTVSYDSHKPMMAIPTVLPQQRPPPGLKWYRRNAKNNPNPLLGSTAQEGGGVPGVGDEQPGGFKSSFLYRYWYIILPLAIMGLFGGVDEEELERQRAGQSGGGAAAGGAAAGAVAAGSASQGRRRGKRD